MRRFGLGMLSLAVCWFFLGCTPEPAPVKPPPKAGASEEKAKPDEPVAKPAGKEKEAGGVEDPFAKPAPKPAANELAPPSEPALKVPDVKPPAVEPPAVDKKAEEPKDEAKKSDDKKSDDKKADEKKDKDEDK